MSSCGKKLIKDANKHKINIPKNKKLSEPK